MYEWKMHVKCWGMILLSWGPLSYQSSGHHGLWARYLKKGGNNEVLVWGHVGISTIILGRPHYSSFTSYSPPPCNHPTCHAIAPSLRRLYHSAAFLYLAVALVVTDSSSLGGTSLSSPPPHRFHHHHLPICSPPSFVDCCVDWWTRSFVELPFTATLFLLPLPCTVWLLCWCLLPSLSSSSIIRCRSRL